MVNEAIEQQILSIVDTNLMKKSVSAIFTLYQNAFLIFLISQKREQVLMITILKYIEPTIVA